MELEILKKKLSTYRTPKGQLRNLPQEIMIEFMDMWEHSQGKSSQLAKELGITSKQLGNLIRYGKAAKRNQQASGFSQVSLDLPQGGAVVARASGMIEFVWEDRIIRFPEVDLLIDFLKKAA